MITKINNYNFVLSVVNKPSNPLQPSFLCSVGKKFSDIQDTPSAAINLVYQEVTGSQTKTKHSELAVLGFYNKEIVSEMINNIPFFLLYVE
ncbi:225_t:CDS:1, partial [Scutellospora calospora]